MNAEERFEFGENWQAFLATVDEQRIDSAVESLRRKLDRSTLTGQSFLDLGSGSGLFSLAAERLGARVLSIDYDETSVACTQELRRRFGRDGSDWQIRQGSVLDEGLMRSLGEFDVVYSWGVLHHTGDLAQALAQTAERTRVGGQLFVAIYNDQGAASRRWLRIKRFYHRIPCWLRPTWVAVIAGYYEAKFAVSRALRGKNPLPFADWRAKKASRGMSAWYDWVDWVGGLPFEVAEPDQIVDRMEKRGFALQHLETVGKGWGCNEYVFRRQAMANT